MKSILVLDYFFPPLGGVGPQRTVKFIKHFRSLGYEPVVVTGPEGDTVDYAPADHVLAAELPAGLRVERIKTFPPTPRGSARRARRLLGRWSAFEDWWRHETTRLARAVSRDVDLVYAGMSPFSSAEVAAEVAEEANIPWIADLQDPWALDDWLIYPTALHRRLDERRMRKALRTASAIVMTTPEAARLVASRFPELAGIPIVSIPFGWDAADFLGAPEPRADGRFRVVYAGYSHVQRGLEHRARRRARELFGGAVRGLDILPRSHVFLVEAMSRLHEEDGGEPPDLELHVAGAALFEKPEEHRNVAIVHHGYLSHDLAVDLMRSADALFLAMHDLPPGMRTATVPGKTYEYLASGRPILGALPEGDARDLLSNLPGAWLCRPADVECMMRALRELIASAGKTDVGVPPALLERLEWGALARDLTTLFDRALSRPAARG